MSTPKMILCTLPLLCAAGAAGFALGRADARAPAPPPCDSAPFTWSPTLEDARHPRLYPSIHKYLVSGTIGTTGGMPAEGQSWQVMPPACPTSKCYDLSAVLLPDGRVIAQGGAPQSIDPSPPAPPSNR